MTVKELETRIAKKEEEIAKREKNILKYIEDEEFVKICDRFYESGAKDRSELEAYRKARGSMFFPDYYNKRYELEEAKAILAKYRKMLIAEQDKQASINELPEVVIQFKEELITKWDAFDIWKKEQIKNDYKRFILEAETREDYLKNRVAMREKWGSGYYDFMYLTDEQIHKANVTAAETLVLNLVDRTVEIAGKITDCSFLHLAQDNQGYSIINGVVIGEKGKARVESIGAGGYNIQRYHIRVLVKGVRQ